MRASAARTVVGAAVVGTAVAGVRQRWRQRPDGAGRTSAPGEPGEHGRLLAAPVAPVPSLLDESMVAHAVAQLRAIVTDAMARTGVPGVAVGVVHDDRVLFAEGFGVRRVGGSERVDADTVFQVASVSKPVASTIVAGVVGRGKATWSDPVITLDPGFALRDPYVTAHATLVDLLSHRSGLRTGAGDLLEDLGWDQQHIFGVLDQQPLDAFRSSYHYSNFGFSAGAVAAARAMQVPWEDLADSMLFGPLGMDRSSYRHADYEAQPNKALIHTRVGPPGDKRWSARHVRDADAEAPAGGLSSSVRDMAQFLRLQLGGGTIDGQERIDGTALQVTHVPHAVMRPARAPGVRTEHYGMGWNVSTDDQGRVRLSHSGAFVLGAATAVALIEGERLGIVTLTNGQPHGIPEAINNAFLDVAQYGEQRVDWLGFLDEAFEDLYTEGVDPTWTTPPTQPRPPADESSFAGTYDNAYYGPLTVGSDDGTLSMSMGPPGRPTTFTLTHFDANTFTYETIGENATGTSGAVFTLGSDGIASTVTLASYDTTGLGTFTRP